MAGSQARDSPLKFFLTDGSVTNESLLADVEHRRDVEAGNESRDVPGSLGDERPARIGLPDDKRDP